MSPKSPIVMGKPISPDPSSPTMTMRGFFKYRYLFSCFTNIPKDSVQKFQPFSVSFSVVEKGKEKCAFESSTPPLSRFISK